MCGFLLTVIASGSCTEFLIVDACSLWVTAHSNFLVLPLNAVVHVFPISPPHHLYVVCIQVAGVAMKL
jgi:hypothetical protein